MKFTIAALGLPALLVLSAFAATVARADGPAPPTWTPPGEKGQCSPIKGSKACKQIFRPFIVNKADGSGVTRLSLIESTSLSYADVAKTAKTLGEPLFPKNDSYTKKALAKRSYFGVMLDTENEIIEPALYPHILPISDKVALALANTSTTFYQKNSPYYTPVNKYYFVNLDGKLTKPEQPGIDPANLYYVGGYYSDLPAQIFELIGRDTARGTVTLRQYDSYGQERAVFNNILLHKRRDNFDSFEVSIYANSKDNFVMSALEPATGERASLWFRADGSVIGYRPPAEVRSILNFGANRAGYAKNTQSQLVEVIGRLPFNTALKDDRLYHPLDVNGERVAAPSNFIGMARLHYSRDSYGDLSTSQKYFSDWLLVYALPTGYGFKISARTSSSVEYPALVRAENVLLDEKTLKMFSGFGFSRIADDNHAMIVRPFDRYEPDGVTPAQGALPDKWRRAIDWPSISFTATEGRIGEMAYNTSTEAFFAFGQQALAHNREYARRMALYQQEKAAQAAERERDRAIREAELKAYYEKQRQQEEEYAKERSKYRRKTGAEEFLEALKNRRSYSIERADGSKIYCQDNGDGTEYCF
ncbi:hypothetical protein ACFOWX_04100 [Sphingorhabdus arenilitoris]|uniref:Uncharacterized protein n=1 Tax=Sphingorhabdus arenilitoris TaxID=1490041 RepID=A0ABV8REH1_9SPHN